MATYNVGKGTKGKVWVNNQEDPVARRVSFERAQQTETKCMRSDRKLQSQLLLEQQNSLADMSDISRPTKWKLAGLR